MTNPVEIVKITTKSPLFKKGTGEPATNIELINFSFFNPEESDYTNECGFNIVSQKDLYQIGERAAYVQPDYCVPDTELFSSFIAPNGDPKKSKLGKNNRIKAIKFNFTKEDSCDVIYSNGILLPFEEVSRNEVVYYDSIIDLAEFLGITKYEEPERFGNGRVKGNLPGFLYKTNEENAANIKSYINRLLEAGEELVYTLKIDGSSFTQYFRKSEGELITGICSRLLEKKDIDDPNNDDRWVRLSRSTGLYERGMKYCQENNRQLAFRGEMYGLEVTKGSGNKLNPHASMKPSIKIFGIDDLDTGGAVRLLPDEVVSICKDVGIDYLVPLPISASNYDELISKANEIFENYKQTENWVIEGIVIRTKNNNKLSTKIMNDRYDEKK